VYTIRLDYISPPSSSRLPRELQRRETNYYSCHEHVREHARADGRM